MAHCGGVPASSVLESHFLGLLDDDDKYRALCGAFGYLQQQQQEWPELSGACYAGFGAAPGAAAAQEASNGGNSFSCSGSASSGGGDVGSRKRKPDAHPEAKVKDSCVRTVSNSRVCTAPVLVHCYCL